MYIHERKNWTDFRWNNEIRGDRIYDTYGNWKYEIRGNRVYDTYGNWLGTDYENSLK